MSLLSKIIFTTITTFIFIFLIFTTFIASNFLTYSKPYYEKINLGLYELKQDNNLFTLSKIEKTNTGGLFIKKINSADKILFSKGEVDFKVENGNSIIEIDEGIFLFDLREINTNYIIKGPGFEINNKGPGLFIINNINIRQNIIFSINSIVNLTLKDYKNNEKDITYIDIFPHTYLIFNPIKNISVKNADLLKISQNFNLGFFKDKIIDEKSISDDFIKLISLNNEKYKNIIKQSILYIEFEFYAKGKIIQNFIDSTFGTIAGENFINKYSVLFINNNKKSLYYKNIILRNLHDLLLNKNLDINNINFITENIEKLKEIDPKGAKEIDDIIIYYYNGIINSNQNINTKINFTKLKNKINNSNNNIHNKSLINLETIFLKYDFLKDYYYYDKIPKFKEEYIKYKDKNIEINKIDKIDYFLFFIENIITSNISNSEINIKDLINIFENYVSIANSFYSYSNDTTTKTGLFINFEILNKFSKIIENKYFLKNRNENMLLELNKNNIIKKDELIILQNNTNKLLIFYKKHINLLNPKDKNKDKNLINNYTILEKKYIEYFDALDSYKEYIIKYDKTKKALLNTNTVNENKVETTLSIENAINYIKQFNGINIKNIKIKIMGYNYCSYPEENKIDEIVKNPYCYKIENLYINNKKISFLLHPFQKNKIDEIIIEYIDNNGNIQKDIKLGSYKLDEIKEILDKKIKNNTKIEEKEKYEFKNFLLNTFGENNEDNVSNNTKNNNIKEKEQIIEDPIIKVFKRNKLLGKYGEFTNLKFININYNDLIVEKKGEEYIIFIKDVLFNISLGTKQENFYGEFSSDYNFAEKHSFINPKLKLIEKKTGQYLLSGNYIYINGEYNVNNIDQEIKKVFYYYEQIKNIINYINNNEIKITYIKDSNQVLFEIFDGKDYIYIKLDNLNIIEVKYKGKNEIESSIPYKKLPNILNNIKNKND